MLLINKRCRLLQQKGEKPQESPKSINLLRRNIKVYKTVLRCYGSLYGQFYYPIYVACQIVLKYIENNVK